MTTTPATKLASYERRYREFGRQLADIGFIASGSVALRYNRCGKAYCACHGDPPRLHGPYWHFTAKVNNKTVNRRLTPGQAGLYSEWIGNDRRAREILAQMRQVAAKAAEVLLDEALGRQDPAATEPRRGAQGRTSARARAQ